VDPINYAHGVTKGGFNSPDRRAGGWPGLVYLSTSNLSIFLELRSEVGVDPGVGWCGSKLLRRNHPTQKTVRFPRNKIPKSGQHTIRKTTPLNATCGTSSEKTFVLSRVSTVCDADFEERNDERCGITSSKTRWEISGRLLYSFCMRFSFCYTIHSWILFIISCHIPLSPLHFSPSLPRAANPPQKHTPSENSRLPWMTTKSCDAPSAS
jgi:hypothetical protein